jgi:sporulation integral membrane protein YtvI
MVIDMNYWRKVIKRIFIFFLTIIGVWLGFKLSVFYMPFLIAFIISLLLEPIIKVLMRKTKLKRKTSAIIVFILAFSIIIGLLTWGIATLISEISNILGNINQFLDKGYSFIQNTIKSFNFEKIQISEQVKATLQSSATEFLGTITEWAKNVLTSAMGFITSIPTIGIYVVITFLALYFICVDKVYMLDQLEHHLPKTWVKKIGIHIRELIKTLGRYLKAQVILILISFVISLIGLYIFHFMGWGIKVPLIAALGIGFVDALPIFGSGTAMLPWAVWCAVNGNLKLAIGLLVLWAIMSIVRQFIEPRIVSGQIGIHPIFTLIAMYTGFKILGVIGMLLGPIILIVLENIFATMIDDGVFKSIFDR